MDYYKILGVPKDASQPDIRKAYKVLAVKNHPDKTQKLPENERKQSENIFKMANEAYEVLGNKKKRTQYDGYLESEEEEMIKASETKQKEVLKELRKDIIGMLDEHIPEPPKEEQRGRVYMAYDMALEDVFTGTTITRTYTIEDSCLDCSGTGFKDKKNHDCSECLGKGVIQCVRQVSVDVLRPLAIPCDDCNNIGYDKRYPRCKTCSGSKRIRVIREAVFKIPKSVPHNTEIYFNDSVILVISIQKHPVYTRCFNVPNVKKNAYDLLRKVDITLEEALCGFKKEITHIDGNTILFQEKVVVNPYEVRVIKGKGLEHPTNPELNGNLYLKYNIKFPEKLTKEQKDVIYNTLTGETLAIKYNDKKNINTMDPREIGSYTEIPNAVTACINQ